MTATIFEAKSRLSELLKRAQAGEEVVITSGRGKTPIAEIRPIPSVHPQRLGFLAHAADNQSQGTPDTSWDPLPNKWTGMADDPDDPSRWSDERIKAVNAVANKKWSAENKVKTRAKKS